MMKTKEVNLKSQYSDEITSTGYVVHGFDRYPAKMIPQMARFLIDEISKPGDTVLDPFCGSGSVLVESLLRERNAVGIDLNPLAVVFAKAKTILYDPVLLGKQFQEILSRFATPVCPYQYDFLNSNYWFTPATLRKLGVIRTVLDGYLLELPPNYMFFWKAVMASIVRECSRADTRGPKPFISKRARARRLGRHFDPIKMFQSTAWSWMNTECLYAAKLAKNGARAQVELGDSRHLSSILGKQQVDAVITSPPYLSAQDYYRSSKLQLFVMGSSETDLKERSRTFIGSDRILYDKSLLDKELPSVLAERTRDELAGHNKKSACVFAQYVLDMSAVLDEISSLLKEGLSCAIVSGYNLVAGVVVRTPEVIVELAEMKGFKLRKCYKDKIRDRWVPTIRNGHSGVIDDEYLLMFQKIT